jgi:outer membrane protein OmpA-like peptidoglycan-associated protein
MKKLILLLAAVALATSVWAQDTPKKPSFAGFVSNGFWDNWEITLGGGAGTALSNGTNQGSFGDRINFEANFGLTKWFHPVTGMRLQLQGGRFANFDDVLGKAKWPYLFVHADFMLNFSNWAGGYREDRAYYAVPFAGFGYMASNFTDKSHENNGSGTHQSFAFTLGWLNKFRISPSFDFNIELKGLIAPSRVSPVAMDGSYLFGFSATAGFTYRFNKRGWQRGVAGYTVADIQAFQDAVAASMAAAAAMEVENAQLAQQLAASQAELAATAATVVAAEEQVAADTSIILFDYSMSWLTPQEKTRLELVAEKIKNGPQDMVYQIVGHADQQTGTKAGNKRVAEHRAKRVFDFLVSKGVNPKQLNYEGKGNSPDPFKKVQAANRAAIIQ